MAVSYKGLWTDSRGVEFWVLGQKPGHWGIMEELPPWGGPESKEIGVGISSYPNQDGPPKSKSSTVGHDGIRRGAMYGLGRYWGVGVGAGKMSGAAVHSGSEVG